MADPEDRSAGLVAWQWSMYQDGHTTRTNLLIHILTVPIFETGTVLLLAGGVQRSPYAILGLLMMAGAMAAQGRGHAGEPQRPHPFRGLFDVLARILAEQWIAFPRYVWSGRFARSWAASAVDCTRSR